MIIYVKGDAEGEQVQDGWRDTNVRIHVLRRNPRNRLIKCLVRGEALPTVDRSFAAEAGVIRGIVGGSKDCRLLLDNNLVAPLARHFRNGVVVSGPDCMSRLFGQVAIHARSARERWQNRVRSWFARNNERRWYHVAEIAHVVSEMDRDALKQVNPMADVRVIPLGLEVPSPGKLRPWEERQGGLIWANMDFAPTGAGVRRLLACDRGRLPGFWEGWTLLGKVPRSAAFSLLPTLESSGLEYRSWCDDVSELLGRSKVVVCPDVGGAGQKNRCLDALAHGCVAVGLPEVFRGLGGESGRHYIEVGALGEIAEAVKVAQGPVGAEISRAGEDLFKRSFSHDALAAKWSNMLIDMKPLHAVIEKHG